MNHIIDFFPRLINMSAIASIVILFVLAARLILKRAPKIFSYALWAIVLIRLLVPIHIPSPISAIPVTQTTNSAEINAALPDFNFETPMDRVENKQNLRHEIETGNPVSVRVSTSLEPVQYLTFAWIAGIGIMVLCSGLSYRKIKKKVRISVLLRDNIFIADDIGSPCVIGFGMPNIYLPNGLSEKEQEYIILHEQHHIKRLDHIIKPDVDLIGQYVIVRGKIESGTGLLVATNISISEKEFSESLEEAINRSILDHNYSPRYEGMLQVASFVQLSSENEGVASVESDMKLIEKATVYGLAYHQVFRLEDGILVEEGGSHIPVALTFTYDASEGFTLTEYWEPRDGSYYAKDLKDKFNGRPWPDTQKYLQQQMMNNYLQAMEYYEVGTDVLINTLLDSVRAKAQFTMLENLIESEDADVQILLHYSNETLEYCFSEFLKGNQTDARADVMAAICKKIISDWGEPLLMVDSNPPQTPQEWFDFYLEQALKHFEELEQDEMIEKFPASCVLLKLTGHMNILPNWGITLRAENATPNGATIILNQEGGYLPNRLFFGSNYNIQKYEENQWVDVEPLQELFWTTIAYSVPLNDSTSWNIDWSNTFGTLDPGLYRFCKGISDHRAPGDNDHATFYAEFVIE